MTSKEIISAFECAAQANRHDSCRQGNIIRLKGPGSVIMTGDLHGNTSNFEKLCRVSQLDKNPDQHLVLHEIIHTTENPDPEQCHSYILLARVAQFKAQYPDQVHIFLGNHAMAQVSRDEVLKNGQPMVRALNTALYAVFSENTGAVMQALDNFIMSLPIAVRTDNRIWLSHSLPSKRHLAKFNNNIFIKRLTIDDMKTNSSLRALTWDRVHSDQCLDELSEMWDVDMFIVGHQPQATGHHRPYERMIILASDHAHGSYLPFQLGKSYNTDQLLGLIKPLAAIG